MNISPHFTWEEVTRSATAEAKRIDNSLPVHLHTSVARVAEFLECVRALVGRPLRVTSWYRCPDLNAAVGSKPTSMHPKGLAADVQPIGADLNVAFERLAASALPFDQLIIERTRSGSAWLHIGLCPPDQEPRRDLLKATGTTGAMTFTRVAEG